MRFFKKRNVDIDELAKHINFIYEEKFYKGARDLLLNTSVELLVVALEKIDDPEIINYFLVVIQRNKIGQFFLSFSTELQIKMLDFIQPILLKKLVDDFNSDDLVDLLSSLPPLLYKKVILSTTDDQRAEVKAIKKFKQGEVGSIMNTTFLTLYQNTTICEALCYLRKKQDEFDIEQDIFILNEDDQVTGRIMIQSLFFAEMQNATIEEFMEKDFVSIGADEDIVDAINLFQKYDLSILAVVSPDQKLLGILTNNDMIPEIIDENVEDIYKLYGIDRSLESYSRSSVLQIVQGRIVWLLILLFATTFTTFLIDSFERWGYGWTAGLSSSLLVPIIPVITDMSGNCGSQTAATIIQAFASNNISQLDFKATRNKEFKVAVVIGIILCLFNFCRLFLYFMAFPMSLEKINLAVGDSQSANLGSLIYQITDKHLFLLGILAAGTSSIALFLIVVISKMFGVIIPFVAIRHGLDPAAVSTPVLTTILDAISAIIFFGLGILMFSWFSESILKMKIINGTIINHGDGVRPVAATIATAIDSLWINSNQLSYRWI